MGGHPALLVLATLVAAAFVSFVGAFQTSRTSSVMGPSSLHGMGSLRSTTLAPTRQMGSSSLATFAAPHVVRQAPSSTGVFVSNSRVQSHSISLLRILCGLFLVFRRFHDQLVEEVRNHVDSMSGMGGCCARRQEDRRESSWQMNAETNC